MSFSSFMFPRHFSSAVVMTAISLSCLCEGAKLLHEEKPVNAGAQFFLAALGGYAARRARLFQVKAEFNLWESNDPDRDSKLILERFKLARQERMKFSADHSDVIDIDARVIPEQMPRLG